jgi:phosphomannomutase
MVARIKRLLSSGEDLSQYVILTSHSTPYFDRIAKHYGCKFIMVPVGFRWLNLAASQIDAGYENIEIEEIHWRNELETLHYYLGNVKGIIGICEESGGGNLGNIKEEENVIGHKSKIAKEKDALKIFYLNQAEASRLVREKKTLVDAYLDITAQSGLGSSHFHRIDLSLDTESGHLLKEAFMQYYMEQYQKYKDNPSDLKFGKTRTERIFRAGDGIKIIFEDKSWLYVRPSGTEPKLKIFSWGESKAKQEYLEKTALMIKDECEKRIKTV